jgi:DNA-binding transcriptional MerR regulator
MRANMDKKSLKSVIVGYKLNGLSYADISARLKDEYGIEMSRQAVNGLYKRATSDKEKEKSWHTVIRTNDICFYNALGYSAKEIKLLIQADGFNLSIAKITELIDSNKDHVEQIESTLVDSIEQGIKNKEAVESLMDATKFREVTVKSKKWNELLARATKQYINDKITEALADVIDITNDRDLVRSMIKEYNINVSFMEIGKKLRQTEQHGG